MILLINKPLKEARALSQMLHYMGVLSLCATPKDALSEASNLYRAIVIMNPRILSDKADYVSKLRSYASIPIFLMCDAPSETDETIFDGIIPEHAYGSEVFKIIHNYAVMHRITSPGTYKLAGINASIELKKPHFFHVPMRLTKTETMILRVLMIMYPVPMNAKKILKYAYHDAKTLELSNVRTHISVMNKKHREITERNLITMVPSEGYRVLTPEILDAMVTR